MYSTNFIALYSLRPVPQIEISRNIGTSSSSQNRKNRIRSWAAKTPITAVCSAISQAKYSRGRSSMRHEISTATRKRRPVSSIIVALRPSTPTKYCTVKLDASIHSMRSVYCNAMFRLSKPMYIARASARFRAANSAATYFALCSCRRGIRNNATAAKAGRKISSESNSSSSQRVHH